MRCIGASCYSRCLPPWAALNRAVPVHDILSAVDWTVQSCSGLSCVGADPPPRPGVHDGPRPGRARASGVRRAQQILRASTGPVTHPEVSMREDEIKVTGERLACGIAAPGRQIRAAILLAFRGEPRGAAAGGMSCLAVD